MKKLVGVAADMRGAPRRRIREISKQQAIRNYA